MTKRTNGDKASRLLNILDKHLNEKNCQHSPEELFDQYSLLPVQIRTQTLSSQNMHTEFLIYFSF